MNERTKQITTAVITAGVGVSVVFLIAYHRKNLLQKLNKLIGRDLIGRRKVQIINNIEDCISIVEKLRNDCKNYPVLGFDAEWSTVSGTRRPVALLQLCSNSGLCALIRLCKLPKIPTELRSILEDEDILKVGVSPNDDAKYLALDYAIACASTLDLRYLANEANFKPEGLGGMSKSLLKIELDKDWRIRCSDWEAPELSERQVDYASKDAFVGIELFRTITNHLCPRPIFGSEKKQMEEILDSSSKYLDVRFVQIKSHIQGIKAGKAGKIPSKEFKRFKCTTRQKPLYDNIPMQAPDGELLCNCDKSKADWYLSKGLATVVSRDPYTIRLTFEPAGRAVGEVGKYYTIAKVNQCVVCGKEESFLRKNVVPREYRKYFPLVMKDHTSHDILLLCAECHQRSNMSDLNLRAKFSKMCDAPLQEGSNVKLLEDKSLKQMQSAARALYRNAHSIPEARKKALEKQILEHLPEGTELTRDLLEQYVDINIYKENEEYSAHGKKVVQYFMEEGRGIIQLERMWREHFLKSMKPKFLPELWSVDHNYRRLEIRAEEGRIDATDLKVAGLDPSIVNKVGDKHESFSESSATLSATSTLKEVPTEFYSERTGLSSQYETAKSDDDTSISISDFKSLDGTLKSFHPEDETIYHSDDSDSTLTQPSSDISLELDSD